MLSVATEIAMVIASSYHSIAPNIVYNICIYRVTCVFCVCVCMCVYVRVCIMCVCVCAPRMYVYVRMTCDCIFAHADAHMSVYITTGLSTNGLIVTQLQVSQRP